MKRFSKKKSSKLKYFVPKFEGTVRVRQVPPLGEHYPPTAQLLLNYFMGSAIRRSSLSFAVNMLPPTANGMYTHSRFNTRLSDETHEFRALVTTAIGSQRFTFKTGGTVAAIVLLESPIWITKKRTLREMDVDNRPKSLFDAVKHALLLADETNWEFHPYKILSKNLRTTVHMFDLGDIVDFYT